LGIAILPVAFCLLAGAHQPGRGAGLRPSMMGPLGEQRRRILVERQ
jgi:hypothetical protein